MPALSQITASSPAVSSISRCECQRVYFCRGREVAKGGIVVAQESQDCAALKVRVAALEAQAGRFQAALDAISQGVAFFDREQRLILANRRYAEIYRLSPDQLPSGITLHEITTLRAAAGTCPMAVDDYLAFVTAIADKHEDRDWSVTLGDGRTIQSQFRPMPDGGWVATHEDTTASRERRMLIDERVSMQSLIDAAPDNLWVKDAESRFVIANRATAERMGHASTLDLVGKSDLELCPWETAQKYLADEREVVATGRPMIDNEEYILNPDGKKLWIATTKVPFRNDRGEVAGIIGVSRDVTKRRLADALREGETEILQLIAAGAPADTVLEGLVHLVDSQLTGIVAAIMPIAGGVKRWRETATSLHAIEERRAALLAGPLVKAVRQGEFAIVPDLAADPSWVDHWAFFSTFDLRSCWATPICLRAGKPVGVLALFARVAREPSEGELMLMQLAAQLAAIVAEREAR
jgi:PAS domain S-box-containing protein